MRGGSVGRLLITGVIGLASTAGGAALRCNPYFVPPAAQGEEMICLSYARIWSGSADEIRNIETMPVPPSFREDYEPDGTCKNTIPQSLIEWHLRFGTERSTTDALQYIDRIELESVPAPAEYMSRLRRAWRAAQADLRCAHTVRQPEGVNYSARSMFVAQSRPIARLRALIGARFNIQVLVDQYLRAAEEYGSLALLERAEGLLRQLQDGEQFLAPLEDQPPAQGLLYFNLDEHRTAGFRLRAAVLRAQLTRSSADLRSAQDLLAATERPLDRRIVETAYSGGDDFCDISQGWSQSEEIEAECLRDEPVQERVVGDAIGRAVLDALSPSTETVADEAVIRVLEREQSDSGGRCCWANSRLDLLRVRLARADGVQQMLSDQIRLATDRHRIDDLWDAALEDLAKAERLLDPPNEPQRFRRIAQRWLRLWSLARQLAGEDGRPSPGATDSRRRYATYLRATLDDLDAIAVGANGQPR